VTEAQWQQLVTDWATVRGWTWWHTPDSRRSNAGLPDLILVRPPRVLFVELKKKGGKLTKTTIDLRTRTRSLGQEETIPMFQACPGVETYVWYPADEPTMLAVLE
jgi:hypothetical protein